MRTITALGLLGLAAAAGCARVDHLGRPPSMTPSVQTREFDAMTAPQIADPGAPARPEASASLWEGQRRSLVGDRRASGRGDILTVVIEINDQAQMDNSTQRARSGSDEMGIAALGGLPQRMAARLPEGAGLDELVETSSSSTFKGSGKIARRDKVTVRLAATVVDELANGTLYIEGSQEVRVNFELRQVTLSGFVRASDIGRNNEIPYDRIAGARISYGGRGQLSDVQQPRYGQQVADMILPF